MDEQKPVALVRVTNKGYAMSLAQYAAYALPEGDYWLYTRPQPAPDAGGLVEQCRALAAHPEAIVRHTATNAAAALTDIQAKLEEARDHGTWQNILIWLGTYRDHLPSEAITLLQQIADEAKTGSAP